MKSCIRVYFTHDIINEIYWHCERSKTTETGGILLGKKINSSDGIESFIILKTSGPGPKAIKAMTMFRPDIDYYNNLLIFHHKNFKYEYLGEWHKHPAGFEHTSYTDLNQVFKIFQEEEREIMICPIITEKNNFFEMQFSKQRKFNQREPEYKINAFFMKNDMKKFNLAELIVIHKNNALAKNYFSKK